MSQEKEQAPSPETKENAPDPVTTYAIHNTVRGRHNRTLRAQQPSHHRFKQHIGDRQTRLIRGRPILMAEGEFLRHLADIKAKAAAGILEVRTAAGELIDLETLKARPVPATPPLPNPPLDSIARDQPWGQEIPAMPGDEPRDPTKEPSLLSDLDHDGEESDETVQDSPNTEHSPSRPSKGRGKAKR